MAKAAEEGLRSREDIARRSEAEARLSADRHCDNAAVLQVSLAPMRSSVPVFMSISAEASYMRMAAVAPSALRTL